MSLGTTPKFLGRLRPWCLSTQPQIRTLSKRHPHSEHATFHGETVNLSYSAHVPDSGNTTDGALVILHGLLGSKRNWGSLSKAFHKDMPQRPVYALDLRNHGNSPRAEPMTYESMASDVSNFIEKKSLTNVALMGHSMGGKVAMAYALSSNNGSSSRRPLSHLIVVDIAPSIGDLSSDFVGYLQSMQRLENLPFGTIKTRSGAEKRLHSEVQDAAVRQFLLTNLEVPSNHHEKPRWIIPLDILSRSVDSLGSFPHQYNASTNEVPITWDGPTLAIKGTKSPYINHKNIPTFRAFFPNIKLVELDTNHWVHAERPAEFKKLVVDFLQSN